MKRSRLGLVLVSAIGLTAAAGFMSGGAAQASNVEGTAFSYDSYVSTSIPYSECLDVPNGSKTNGEYVQQWRCNGNPQQEWLRIQTLPSHGSYLSNALPFLYQNVDTGKCLSILNNSNSPGAPVIQWGCDFSGNDLYELWFQYPDNACSAGGLSFPVSDNLGQFDSSSHPTYAFHASGGGLANGLHLYSNDDSFSSSYCWYNPPLVIP